MQLCLQAIEASDDPVPRHASLAVPQHIRSEVSLRFLWPTSSVPERIPLSKLASKKSRIFFAHHGVLGWSKLLSSTWVPATTAMWWGGRVVNEYFQVRWLMTFGCSGCGNVSWILCFSEIQSHLPDSLHVFFRIQHLNIYWVNYDQISPEIDKVIKNWARFPWNHLNLMHDDICWGDFEGFPTKSLPKFQVYNRSSPFFSCGKVSKNPPASAFYRAWQPSCTLSVDPKFCNWSCGHGLEHSPILREKNRPTLLRHMGILPCFTPKLWKLLLKIVEP